mgnify:FL=1
MIDKLLPPPVLFQSTLPARGATRFIRARIDCTEISIHAPRTGSDGSQTLVNLCANRFQSTLPARGATAAIAGSAADGGNFNPRSPHGERLKPCGTKGACTRFQSTLPARGATAPYITNGRAFSISIHAPRTGSDMDFQRQLVAAIFQSTLPARGATRSPLPAISLPEDFNPRSPHGERRIRPPPPTCKKTISIHAPRTGSDKPSVSAQSGAL